MLPKENRLTKTRDFDNVFKKGRFFGTKFLSFKYATNSFPDTRVGFVVSTKVSKSAVKRNRLKRRMREVIRLNLAKIESGYDISIISKPGAAEMEYGEIERDLLFALGKIGLIYPAHSSGM